MRSLAQRLVVVAATVAATGVSAQLNDFDARFDLETTRDATTFWQGSGGATSAGSYALSSENVFGNAEILSPGFLTGMRSTSSFRERFAEPIGNPIYFESPFIDSNVRAFYLWHDFPSSSALGGGQANIWATQVRVALTDRLAFIAPKDGYSELKTGILGEDSGWNDFAIGLKYAFIVDESAGFMLTGGLRWEWHNGNTDILMGGDGSNDELSPFVSFAQTWGQYNLIGNITSRLPLDDDDGNYILSWDLHLDTEIAPDTLPGFHPLIELHALHYLSDGDALGLNVGGLDYSNVGSADVSGNNVFWGDLGFRWKLTPNVSVGAAYGFPISNPSDSIFNQRLTFDMILRF